MIKGAGLLNFFFNTESYGLLTLPACAASFEFSVTLTPLEVTYLGPDGIIKTREAGPVKEEYTLSVNIQDIDFSHLMASYGELSILTEGNVVNDFINLSLTGTEYVDSRIVSPESVFVFDVTNNTFMQKVTSSPTSSAQYFVDWANNKIEFHPDSTGDDFDIVINNPSQRLGTIGHNEFFELVDNVSFQGKFFATTSDGPYSLVIDNLDRISSPVYNHAESSLSIQYKAVRSTDVDNDRKPFRMYAENLEGVQTGDDPLIAVIVFADFPDSFAPCASSTLNLAGVATLVSNPDSLPVETVDFTSIFDFATPGTETINFTTDAQGVFNIIYTVDDNLVYPTDGFFTVFTVLTGDIAFQKAIDVLPEPVFPFAANLTKGVLEQQSITVSGTGKAGETVTLASTNLDGLFNGTVVEVLLNNSWSISDFLPATVTAGTSYSITATHSVVTDTPVVLNETVQVRNFDPQLTHAFPFYTASPVSLQNFATVRPNQDIDIQVESPDLVFVLTTVTSDDLGNFFLTYTIPSTEQDKLLTYTFTEVSTTTTVILNLQSPEFNVTPLLSVDAGQGDLQAGEDSLAFTFAGSDQYLFTFSLYDADNNFINNIQLTGLGNSTNIAGLIVINMPFLLTPGNTKLEVTETIHNTVAVEPIPVANANIVEGLTAEITSPGIIVPDGSITFSGLGPVGATIDLNVFSTPYNTTAASDQTWQIIVPVSAVQPVGMYTATVTTSGLLPFQVDIDFDVVSPALTLTACPPSLLFTGGQGANLSLNGDILPGKDVTITFAGLDGRAPVVITGDQDGNWQYLTFIDWLPSGTYTITITSPGETTIICNGSHEGRLDFPNLIVFTQGDTGNSVLVRGPENTTINFNVDGVLETTVSQLTNALGFTTLNLPDISLVALAPDSGTVNIETATLTQSAAPGYGILVRVPITINVSNPSTLAAGGLPVLWINSNFLVVGALPTNGIYGFTAIGSTSDFSLLTAASDAYTANLDTSDEAGIADLTVSTISQPFGNEQFIVSPVTTFELPQTMIVNNIYDAVIFSDDGTLAEILITSPVDGTLLLETGTVGETVSGEFRVQLDTTGLTEGVDITFSLKTEYFSFEPQDRPLGGFSSGLPSALVANVNGVIGVQKLPSFAPTNVDLTTDNQPINEAGFLPDLTSDAVFSWTAPLNLFGFQFYLLESYQNAATSWTTFSFPTGTSEVISDLTRGYRLTAVYDGFIYSPPEYAPSTEGVIFAKSVPSINVGADGQNNSDLTPVVPSPFFTFTNIRPTDEDPFTSVNVGADGQNNSNLTPAAPFPFFTFTTIRPTDEDSLLTNVGADGQNNSDLTPAVPSPFFTTL